MSATAGLRDVSFDVRDGGFTSVLGPSGCGKSTLLKMIAGLLPPSAGQLELHGRALNAPPPGLIYVFQQYSKSLLPWKTVLGNVMFGARSPRARQASATAVTRSDCIKHIELVGLAGHAHSYPSQLSGGMQQRVAIARALVARPQVLLMDEPFSALDAMMRVELQDLLLKLWADLGLTILFVTHDLDEALYLAQRVIMLSASPGTIAEVVEVALPYPRRQIETRSEPAYLRLRERLYRSMVEQVVAGREAAP